jgi:hypothetical protein
VFDREGIGSEERHVDVRLTEGTQRPMVNLGHGRGPYTTSDRVHGQVRVCQEGQRDRQRVRDNGEFGGRAKVLGEGCRGGSGINEDRSLGWHEIHGRSGNASLLRGLCGSGCHARLVGQGLDWERAAVDPLEEAPALQLEQVLPDCLDKVLQSTNGPGRGGLWFRVWGTPGGV